MPNNMEIINTIKDLWNDFWYKYEGEPHPRFDSKEPTGSFHFRKQRLFNVIVAAALLLIIYLLS